MAKEEKARMVKGVPYEIKGDKVVIGTDPVVELPLELGKSAYSIVWGYLNRKAERKTRGTNGKHVVGNFSYEVHEDNSITITRKNGEILADRQMTDLSGGQLQRVLLARALLSTPEILMLDEPTQGLDQPGEAAFYRLIEEVRRTTGAAILMVSHDLHVVMAASDRVICLNRHICCEGAPRVVSNAPEYRALFGLGTQGALALYRHEHDHDHTHDCGHAHTAGQPHQHGQTHV